MGLKRSIYISDVDEWERAEEKAKEKGISTIQWLLDVHADVSKEKPKKEAPRVSADQEEVAARLRAKMKERGEPIMTPEQLSEYREALANGDHVTRMRMLVEHQKKMGMFGGRYERPRNIVIRSKELNAKLM